MSSADLVLGTSARRFPSGFHIPNRGGGAPRDEEIQLPDGVAHAVPRGQPAALCGAVPPYLWLRPFTGEKSRVLDVCVPCRELAE